MMKTYMAKKSEIERQWFVVDAEGQVLGRMAAQVAAVLRGKHKPTFTPHVDTGDFVIVVNADKVKLTGNKLDQKKYYRHSGYPGGIKEETARHLMERKPEEVIKNAVWGMLPKGSLGRRTFHKLKVYKGSTHPHAAQSPEPLNL